MESPSNSTLTGWVTVTAGIPGVMAESTGNVVLVAVGPVPEVLDVVVDEVGGVASTPVAPTGTNVEAMTAPMAAAAPSGVATHERQLRRAPRRMGSSMA